MSTDAQKQALCDQYAPAQDMLGNIDACAIRSAFGLTNTSARRVSQILREFYLGDTGSRGEHRYSRCGCRPGRLTSWSGGRISNEADGIDRYTTT